MDERPDDQKALKYVLDSIKESRTINFGNTIGLCREYHSDIDPMQVSEVLQDLYLDGWFCIDPDAISSNWLILTSYGRSQLGLKCYPAFLDPVSTIVDLKDSVPNIDNVALDYFQEALWAIKKRLYLSATVTMGCASEQSILLLINAALNHYNNESLYREFEKLNSIKKKFDLLTDIIKRNDLRKELLSKHTGDKKREDDIKRLFIDIDTLLEQMFSIYRINRNEAGHPSGRKFDENIVKANAAMFKKYCEIVYALISYLQ